LQIDPNGEFVRGVILTVRTNEHSTDYIDGKGNVYDFASRYFAPWVGINEDPATGLLLCKTK
jgi:predicted PhzF superfamily epimerase YddE/YHI9